jgi:hypothetical protein
MHKIIILVLVTMANLASAADKCSRYCTPGKSKPCGAACIPQDSLCRKSWTTACLGERPAEAEKSYSNPKHVDERPTAESKGK